MILWKDAVMPNLERKIERIIFLLEKLRDESSEGALLLVEGQKDAEALRSIGVESEILAIKSCGENLIDLINRIEKCGKKEIVLLMDFDRYGREITERLVQNLERIGVKINLSFWREMLSLVERDLKDIEGLVTYLETLERKSGKKIYLLSNLAER
ncbi:toprim domain-containing protein [Candidatus Bathyarchaeota archaeon]|nr:toprim domain-containing protein [Candidatus Bathyarchaeota archaeon]